MPDASKPPASEAAVILGERVRAERTKQGLSLEKLAEGSELHWSYIGQVERGRNNPTLHSILRIAAALGVDPGKLIEGLAPPPA